MATYVLVAGAWHGSWCWSKVVSLLEAAGHCVLAPDLLGMTEGEPVATEEPLRRWADQIADLVQAQDDPVVLVGHSRAGIVISEVAERIPARIDLLIYLCAFLLKDGETVIELAQRWDNWSTFSGGISMLDDGTSVLVPAQIKDMFYGDAADDELKLVQERVVPEPTASFTTPVRLTEDRFGSVARAYIECIGDQAIPLAGQREMQGNVGVAATATLEGDHSPMLSRPHELIQALESIRAAVGVNA